MYEILAYLFENCHQADLTHNRHDVAKRLSAAGFHKSDISEALGWMAGVVRAPQHDVAPLPDAQHSFRAYAPKELVKLDTECRGLLLSLEQAGILTAVTRELAIERALAASAEPLTVEQLRLIVLMVLWSLRAPASRLLAAELYRASPAARPS